MCTTEFKYVKFNTLLTTIDSYTNYASTQCSQLKVYFILKVDLEWQISNMYLLINKDVC